MRRSPWPVRRQKRIRAGSRRLRASASRAGARTVVCPLEASGICRRGTIHNWASRNLRPFRIIRWRRRFPKKSERRGGGMPHVMRMQERLRLAMQSDVHEMRRFGPFAPQSPQERFARVKPRVIRQCILRRLNSRLGVVQLPGVNKNRWLKYVGLDVDRVVAKSAVETFLGLFEVPLLMAVWPRKTL